MHTTELNLLMSDLSKVMRKQGASADEIAKMEIAIQYFGNPDFKKALNDYVFNHTYKKEK